MAGTSKQVNLREMIKPSHRVVLFGESSHNVSAYKTEMTKFLQPLKVMGFTCLGLEMVPTDLNGFKGAAQNKRYSEHFKEFWDWQDMDGSNVSGDYMTLVKTANQLGMKVVGLDMPYQEFDKHECKKKFKECKTSSHLARNHHMVEHIQSLLKQGHRIVAFMHYFHAAKRAEYETGVKQLLRKVNIQTVFIKLVGGSSSRLPTEIAARNANAADKRFYIPGSGPRSEDYIIHLPQKY